MRLGGLEGMKLRQHLNAVAQAAETSEQIVRRADLVEPPLPARVAHPDRIGRVEDDEGLLVAQAQQAARRGPTIPRPPVASEVNEMWVRPDRNRSSGNPSAIARRRASSSITRMVRGRINRPIRLEAEPKIYPVVDEGSGWQAQTFSRVDGLQLERSR